LCHSWRMYSCVCLWVKLSTVTQGPKTPRVLFTLSRVMGERTLVRDCSATRNDALRSRLNRRRLKKRSRLVLYVRRRAVCVASFFIKLILGNCYGPGVIPYDRRPGVAGSSPSTLTMSLATSVPSSSSSNGPTTTPLTTRGLCPGESVGWAGPKFVRPHWWESYYWVMVRFLGHGVPISV